MAVELAPVVPVVPAITGNATVTTPENAGKPTGQDTSGSGSGKSTTPVVDQTIADTWSGLLDADNRDVVISKGWKSQDALVKSYRDLEAAYSKRHDEVGTFKAEEYKLTKPANLPDGMPYDDNLSTGFVSQASKLGIAPKAAEGLFGWFVDTAAKAYTAQTDSVSKAATAAIDAASNALTSKWGDQATEGFKKNTELAQRALRMSDPALKEIMVASGAIKVVGGKEMVANAGAFEALAKIGGAMFAEDSMNSSPTVGNNPFDPKTENLTAQGKIIKENPERAKLLINAAGPQAVAIHKWWMDRASPK